MARIGKNRNGYRIWGRNLGGKRPLGRPWCRLKYNIKIILHNLCVGGYGLDNVARDREKLTAVT